MKVKHKSQKELTSNPPGISLDEAQHGWFTLASVAYAVETCTVQQFRVFVEQCAPSGWSDLDVKVLLHQSTLDMLDRWFVLSLLPRACMTLYPSRAAAEHAIEKAAQARNIA
jgi:hypothetical protein